MENPTAGKSGSVSALDSADRRGILPTVKILPSLLLVLLPMDARAIPNSVFGPVAAADSPLNGRDLTGELMAAPVWNGHADLPGKWQPEGNVASAEMSHLLARPKLFGCDVVLLRAAKRDGRLQFLEATFADAGSYFGYYDEKPAEKSDRRALREEIQRKTAERQAEFSRLYESTLDSLKTQLADDGKPKVETIGRSRVLRAETTDYQNDGRTVRLWADGKRLIRATIYQNQEPPDSWLDEKIEEIPAKARAQRLKEFVNQSTDGTVSITGLQPLPQGYRPYCGLNSLAMVARHFGLYLDEDGLAVAGAFQNTGSADGSKILSLYPAVASEAGFGLDRANRFDENTVRRALAAGFPVIVWRRFSQERNDLHTRFVREFTKTPQATLPDPSLAAERASWPGSDAPLHASVITGFHDTRREFLFLESWSGRDTPRRMRVEEMAATAYLTFVFHP